MDERLSHLEAWDVTLRTPEENTAASPDAPATVQRDSRGRLLPGSRLATGNPGPWGKITKPRRDWLAGISEAMTDEQFATGFQTLAKKFARGERWAMELVLAYMVGTPIQRTVDVSGELKDLLRSWKEPVTIDGEATDVQEGGEDDV